MLAQIFLMVCPLLQAHPITIYDQSQTGDFNVQVDLKDIQIIALMKSAKEEYVDYDYAYDYSEMTIKPQNGTTAKPLNVTSAASNYDNATKATPLPETTTEPTKNVSSLLGDSTMPEVLTNTSSKTTKAFSESTTTSPNAITSSELAITTIDTKTDTPVLQNNLQSATNGTNCKKGLAVNQKGDCALKIQGTGNALMKLVKLSQKLKLRRENRTNQMEPTATQ